MTHPSPDADKERLIEELRAAVAARDEFIAIAAHELRNPMTPIVGQVQLLVSRARREQVSASLLQGLEMLETAVDHYMRRATTLLEITRVNADKVRLEPTTFDMCELVQACAGNYEQIAVRSGSKILCRCDGPVIGTWDRLATEQILDNLLSNAIRYGEGEPVSVEVASDGEQVVLRVTDRGIGIAAADCVRIFERFERARDVPRSGGFGIGLWLSQKLAQAQGGSLEVKSEPGAGSTFIVGLPRRVPDHARLD
jgi:two-component system, OmpR family, sensor kinase